MALPVEKVVELIKHIYQPISLEVPMGNDQDSQLIDFIEDQKAPSPAEVVTCKSVAEQTREVMATLTPRAERIL